jgi:hypothetical protein
MEAGKVHKAFITYDALFSIIPIMLLAALILQSMAFVNYDGSKAMSKQQTMDFLVATADYVINDGAVKQDSMGNRIPNWIDESRLPAVQSELQGNVSKSINIAVGAKPEGEVCIYRLVLVGPERSTGSIEKLYVCGDYANS